MLNRADAERAGQPMRDFAVVVRGKAGDTRARQNVAPGADRSDVLRAGDDLARQLILGDKTCAAAAGHDDCVPLLRGGVDEEQVRSERRAAFGLYFAMALARGDERDSQRTQSSPQRAY